MKKPILLALLLILVLLYVAAIAEEDSPIIVTIDKTEVTGGDTITAHYQIDREGIQILKAEWINNHNGHASMHTYTDLTEMEDDIPFTACYDGTCVFTMSCTDDEGTIYQYESDEITVHGITFRLISENDDLFHPYDLERFIDYPYMDYGKTYTCELKIENHIGDVTVKTSWYYQIPGVGNFTTEDETLYTDTITGTYTPPELNRMLLLLC